MTDHDLRTRVVAEGLPGDAPVSAAMSAPAVHVRAGSHGRRGAARDGRPRAFATCPWSRHRRRRARRHRGHRPARRPSPLLAVPAPAHRCRPEHGRAGGGRRGPAPDGHRPARRRASAARNLDGRLRRPRSMRSPGGCSSSSSSARPRRQPFAWLSLGSQARRESLPGLRRRQRAGVVRSRATPARQAACSISGAVVTEGLMALRAARRRARRERRRSGLRALAELLAAAASPAGWTTPPRTRR